ncbi:rabl3 [Symbiodinium natans]|uniref:Rabl3 protein n=1 Tax=Symbiodinium natans TaxID=878477 RepID=A0A812LBB4_9DINO|nr:rabl3 [Symbiodinium natans]
MPAWSFSGLDTRPPVSEELPEAGRSGHPGALKVRVETATSTTVSSSPAALAEGTAMLEGEDLPCGHLPIDDWDENQPGASFKVVLLGTDTQGRFGNELFVAAVSLIAAARAALPVLLSRNAGDEKRQILQLPCLRSSRHLAQKVKDFCKGCNPGDIWKDRSNSCNRGRGCLQHLQSKKMVLDPSGGGFHQDLSEWRDPPLKWRPLLQKVFHTPMPKLQAPVALPDAADLVMYFRPFKRKQVFDVYNSDGRLSAPPFSFFAWAAAAHRRAVSHGKLWVVADPSLRTHPTVTRLVKELGAELFKGMDQVPKQAWLGDFVWLRAAAHVAISPSTFAWWAAFLSEATTVYVPVLPGQVPMPWCPLLPEDPRYVFFDVWNNESLTEEHRFEMPGHFAFIALSARLTIQVLRRALFLSLS